MRAPRGRSIVGVATATLWALDVDWGRNLVAARGGELVQLGRRLTLRHPRIVGIKEAGPQLPAGIRQVLRAANLPGYVLADLARPAGGRARDG